ncbi:hypothetical protein QCA50_015419 [Cerrena zonata]|uniref:SAM domain-containing protein n=1 Tax=Cerrena zonata TaxID=2478898 RepID=A0AAW0FY48_9APHY
MADERRDDNDDDDVREIPHPGHPNGQQHTHPPAHYPQPHYMYPPQPNYQFHPSYHYPPPQYPPAPPGLHYGAPWAPPNQVPVPHFPPPNGPPPNQPAYPMPAVPSQGAKPTPNTQVGPGDFSFRTDVLVGGAKRTFTAQTDMPWTDFKDRCIALLDGTPKPIQLAYKVLPGDTGQHAYINDMVEFAGAMGRIRTRAYTARTKAVYMEVKNVTKKTQSTARGKKRARSPSPSAEMDGSLLETWKKLETHIRCERHGHCLIRTDGNVQRHQILDHKLTSLWTKAIFEGKATVYVPPNISEFDQLSTQKQVVSKSSSSVATIPQLHLTIENVQGASSHTITSSQPAASSSHVPISSTEQEEEEHAVRSLVQMLKNDSCFRGEGNTINDTVVVPSIGYMLEDMDMNIQGFGFRQLEPVLRRLGIEFADIMMSIPVEMLAAIDVIGMDRAQRLTTYSQRFSARLLGLRRSYGTQFDNIPGPSGSSSSTTNPSNSTPPDTAAPSPPQIESLNDVDYSSPDTEAYDELSDFE